MLHRPGQSARFDGVHGGTRVTLVYSAAAATEVEIRAGGSSKPVRLPATGGATVDATSVIEIAVSDGATVSLASVRNKPRVAISSLAVSGQYQAEFTGGLYNGTHGTVDSTASQGSAVTDIDVVGASVVFTQVRSGDRIEFRYAATRDTQMTILGIGAPIPLSLPSTGGVFGTVVVEVVVPDHATVIVQRNAGDQAIGLTIDWLRVSGQLT